MGPWVISMGPQIQGPSPRTHSAVYLILIIFFESRDITEIDLDILEFIAVCKIETNKIIRKLPSINC
jgi:hypothetical protein